MTSDIIEINSDVLEIVSDLCYNVIVIFLDIILIISDVIEKRPVEQHEEESDSFSQKLSFTVAQSKLPSIQTALQDIQGTKLQLFGMYVPGASSSKLC